MTSLKSIIAATVFAAFTSTMAQATIVSGSVVTGGGDFIKLDIPLTGSTPGNTVGDDNFQDLNLYGFDESQNTTITGDLAVDILADGTGGSDGAGTLLDGTVVASHYVFFDPAGIRNQTGYVSFDSEILAILTSTASLFASDYLANTGVTYLNPHNRGLESGQDSVSITGLNEIFVDWRAQTPGDYIRVLTAFSPAAEEPVPAPATIALFGLGLLALRRARRKS